jgi:type IV secretory pathway TraG/TraD family ATPase VirD4
MASIINALFEIVFTLLGKVITGICDGIISMIPNKVNTNYNASFGDPNKILGTKGGGFHIASFICSQADSQKHLICIAASGAGKSTNLCFPLLLHSPVPKSSYIVLDPSKELFNGSASWLKENDFAILHLNLDHAEKSEGFNVLSLITCYADIYRIASILIKNSQDSTVQDYWLQSAEQLIVFYIKFTIGYEPEAKRNLPHILELLKMFSYSSKELNMKIVATANEDLINEFKSIIATPEKTLQCSISTALVALRIYDSPNIKQLCQNHTIDFNRFFNEKCILYISCTDTYLYRSVTAGFFEMLLAYIIKRPAYSYKVPLTILLDEAATMKISLSQALSVVRKQGVCIASFWQSYEQIESTYSKQMAATIYDNSHIKVFLPSNKSLQVCTMLEKLFGRYSYVTPENPNQLKTRELMTIQEIRECKKIIALIGVEKPLLIEPCPYYLNKELVRRSQLPVYQVQPSTLFHEKSSNESNHEREE